MDLYLINGQEGLTLPEMIDWDIKLSDSDISKEVGVNGLIGVGCDFPLLDGEDDPNSIWSQSYSANSNSSFDLDFLGEGGSTLLVNPSSVMPFVSTMCKQSTVECTEGMSSPKKSEDSEKVTIVFKTEGNCSNEEQKMEFLEERTETIAEELEETGSCDQVQKATILPVEIVSIPTDSFIEITPAKKPQLQKKQVLSCVDDETTKFYPKPAYSYSCLIAMALKNSQSGCLPVSEIYSFMCHHFPYFKTAPSGWKNSVRHNLSLNKCFEKIEKPSGTSGSQRKGCLWAMNPAKITKMDEEVAKWSRKDPSAIKNAMVCPDNLGLLERGELKDEVAFGQEEIEEDVDEIKEEEVEEGIRIDIEDDRISPIDDDSDEEMSRVPPSLQPFEPKFAKKVAVENFRDNYGVISDLNHELNFEISNGIYEELEVADRRILLGLDDSTPIYAVDPRDENMLIELPIVKKPRVQGSYICHPIMKRHKISDLTSIKVQSP